MPTYSLPSPSTLVLDRRAFLRLGAAGLGAAALGGAGRAWAAPAGRLRLRLATLLPKDTSGHRALKLMADQWRKATAGAVDLSDIYTDGTMGGEPDMLRRIRIGQLHAAVLTASGLSEIDPAVACLQKMPLVFRTLDEVAHVARAMRPRFQQQMQAKGFVLLFMGDAGWVRYFSKTAAVVPDQFRKLKMFTGAGDKDYIEAVRAMGFHPVPLEYNDILTALTTGNMIDALASAPFYALAGQFYTAAPNMVEVNWVPMSGGAVIAKKVWDTLAPERQAQLLEIAAAAGESIQQASRRESEEAVEAMKKRGLQVHTLDASARAAWERFAQEVQAHVRGRLVPAGTYDEVLRILEAYRAASPRGGG